MYLTLGIILVGVIIGILVLLVIAAVITYVIYYFVAGVGAVAAVDKTCGVFLDGYVIHYITNHTH